MTQSLAEVAASLDPEQRAKIMYPVRGIISGWFCVADTPAILKELHAAGICAAPFEPTDFATRGYRHAARLTPLGLSLRDYIKENDGG